MKLKTYRAFTMTEALDAVRHDLGEDAVVLNTRSLRKGGFLGIGGRNIVEIMATTADDANGSDIRQTTQPKSTKTPPTAAKPATASREKTNAKTHRANEAYLRNLTQRAEANGSPTAAPTTDASPTKNIFADVPPVVVATDEDRKKTRDLAKAMLRDIEERKAREYAEQIAGQSAALPTAPSDSAPAQVMPTVTPPVTPHAAPADTPAVIAPTAAASINAIPTPAPAPASVNTDNPPATAVDAAAFAPKEPQRRDPVAPVARRFALRPVNGETDKAVLSSDDARERTSPTDSQPISPAAATPTTAALSDELTAIKDMVGKVLQTQTRSSNASAPSMPQALFDMYLKLVGQDLSEELADQIVNDVRDALTPDELNNAAAVRDAVARRLAEFVPCAEQGTLLESPDGRPICIALVGPTGVGKTTTLAKLAATYKLRHGRKVGLITSDTYRIAAVDQLRTYANIIGLPLQVVLTPPEMQQAVHALRDCEVILIDTAGRSQNDHNRIAELKRFLEAANPHEVHLVLSSTASERVMLQEAESFSSVGVDRVAFTKLDEAVSFGMLVNVVNRIGTSLSFMTNGQEVPENIEVGKPSRVAELILTGEVDS